MDIENLISCRAHEEAEHSRPKWRLCSAKRLLASPEHPALHN
jgi:hypothetical protein